MTEARAIPAPITDTPIRLGTTPVGRSRVPRLAILSFILIHLQTPY